MIALLRHLFLDDFWLKLFSFVLAVLTWLTVSFAIQKEVTPIPNLTLEKNGRRPFPRLPVAVLSSAADVRNFKVEPSEVQVTVEGDAKLLKSLQSRDIRVMVDLTGIESATELRARVQVSTPANVSHIQVDPPEVKVVIPPPKS